MNCGTLCLEFQMALEAMEAMMSSKWNCHYQAIQVTLAVEERLEDMMLSEIGERREEAVLQTKNKMWID